MAIFNYLEDEYRDVPLIPQDTEGKARVAELSEVIMRDIAPLLTGRPMVLLRFIGTTEQKYLSGGRFASRWDWMHTREY